MLVEQMLVEQMLVEQMLVKCCYLPGRLGWKQVLARTWQPKVKLQVRWTQQLPRKLEQLGGQRQQCLE
jgi:hypothetical protein